MSGPDVKPLTAAERQARRRKFLRDAKFAQGITINKPGRPKKMAQKVEAIKVFRVFFSAGTQIDVTCATPDEARDKTMHHCANHGAITKIKYVKDI